jgi:hypothetical protein
VAQNVQEDPAFMEYSMRYCVSTAPPLKEGAAHESDAESSPAVAVGF